MVNIFKPRITSSDIERIIHPLKVEGVGFAKVHHYQRYSRGNKLTFVSIDCESFCSDLPAEGRTSFLGAIHEELKNRELYLSNARIFGDTISGDLYRAVKR